MNFERQNKSCHLSDDYDVNPGCLPKPNQLTFLPTVSLHSITEYLDDIKMSRRRGKDYENVDYVQLPHNDNGFTDAQFQTPAQKIPWKSLILASLLFVFGAFFLIFGSVIASGSLDFKYADRMWPMIILGVLMFIPGAYHVCIAFYAYKNVQGYSFDDIPGFD